MELNFLELLVIFTVFYIFKMLADSKYKAKDKRKVALDIISTSILTFVLLWIINRFLN